MRYFLIIFFTSAITLLIVGCNKSAKEIEDESVKNSGGIGIKFELDSTNGYTLPRIISVYPNTPAAQVYLKEGSYIQYINGTSCRNIKIDDIQNHIGGEIGTEVKLSISVDKNGTLPYNYTVIRSATVGVDLFVGFSLGMDSEQVLNQINKLILVKQAIDMGDGIISCTYDIGEDTWVVHRKFYFFEDKLYRERADIIACKSTSKKALTDIDIRKHVRELFNAGMGHGNKTGTQPNAYMYWLDGIKRIDFFDSATIHSLVFSSIPMERKILAYNAKIDSENYIARQQWEQKQNEALQKRSQRPVEYKVADDAVKEYEIAARQGDRMQMYVQAGLCAAAFLQAQDEPNYRKWKDIERKIGDQIRMPHY